MKQIHKSFRLALVLLAVLMAGITARAADDATLVSVSITNGTPVMPRTLFTQSWTFQNTGTTTWPTGSSYTLNLIGTDSLGAIPLHTNTTKTFTTVARISSNTSIAPGAQGTFKMMFIAPEKPGLVSNVFQLNNSSGVFFGPLVAVQINVQTAGSTNQYDRARAVSYANNYAAYVASDGYFWTNGNVPASWSYFYYGAGAPVPTNLIGDDCAHFVSCCIGREANLRGGGIYIPSRTSPTYGEPGAGRLVNTVLIGGCYAKEVSTLNEMEPGDVIGWNWGGDPNIANLDHVTMYTGNGHVASHAASCLNTSATTWYASSAIHHYIHIFDAPTLDCSVASNKMIFSWTTNWAGYNLYSSTNVAAAAAWKKVTTTPTKVGNTYRLTNTLASPNLFYRLSYP
ncbi:MAG: NBR1-Ig-like domain-containing protein [Limisphaerales bacterium]